MGSKRRGFAAMSPERHRELSSQGGKLAHKTGKAHEFTREEAQKAGRKGGLTAQRGKVYSKVQVPEDDKG